MSPLQSDHREDAAFSLVADIPELVALILSALDIKTLLFAQRVNRTFRDIIQKSRECQQALYFVGEPALTTSPRKARINTLLLKKFRPWLERKDLTSSTIDSHEVTTRGHAFLRREASWRKMLIMQPPIRKLRMCFDLHRGAGIMAGRQGILTEDLSTIQAFGSSFELAAHKGMRELIDEVRMGLLYDVTEEDAGETPGGGCWSRIEYTDKVMLMREGRSKIPS